jgi:hypothetical protein
VFLTVGEFILHTSLVQLKMFLIFTLSMSDAGLTLQITVSGVRNYLSFYSGVLLGWGKGCSHLGQQNPRDDKMNILSWGEI